ncbi:hypothetical protein NEOKW01_0441 [Nematocida sp. AWRm80]|nr:hypothetical protein NEOKW01_0441 [Nematocida sp. AWRm80]
MSDIRAKNRRIIGDIVKNILMKTLPESSISTSMRAIKKDIIANVLRYSNINNNPDNALEYNEWMIKHIFAILDSIVLNDISIPYNKAEYLIEIQHNNDVNGNKEATPEINISLNEIAKYIDDKINSIEDIYTALENSTDEENKDIKRKANIIFSVCNALSSLNETHIQSELTQICQNKYQDPTMINNIIPLEPHELKLVFNQDIPKDIDSIKQLLLYAYSSSDTLTKEEFTKSIHIRLLYTLSRLYTEYTSEAIYRELTKITASTPVDDNQILKNISDIYSEITTNHKSILSSTIDKVLRITNASSASELNALEKYLNSIPEIQPFDKLIEELEKLDKADLIVITDPTIIGSAKSTQKKTQSFTSLNTSNVAYINIDPVKTPEKDRTSAYVNAKNNLLSARAIILVCLLVLVIALGIIFLKYLGTSANSSDIIV